jgi:hypothetical protein
MSHTRHPAAFPWAGLLVLPLAAAIGLAPSTAAADDGGSHGRIGEDTSTPFPPYAYPFFTQVLAGVGAAPTGGAPNRPGVAVAFTTEIGHRPFGAALGTGFSISEATEVSGAWTVVVPGLFAKIDLAYLFAGGLWTSRPPDSFPFRLLLGGRVGLAVSESFPSRTQVPFGSPFMLVRAELQPFLDFEWPPCFVKDRAFSLVVRGALDTSVNLSDVFRWSASLGLNYGWDHE